MYKIRELLVIIIYFIVVYAENNKLKSTITTDDLKQLRKYLFITQSYDKFVRPIPKSGGNTTVNIDFGLIHITEFNVKSQTLTVEGWPKINWTDDGLRWDNKEEFKNIAVLRMPSDQIYKPDLMAYNGIEHSTTKMTNTNALVYPNGMVLWVTPITLKALCKVDLSRWPYDRHLCFIQFGSWTMDGFTMDLTANNDGKSFLNNFYENTEFDVKFVNVTRVVKYYSCCTEPYPSVTYYFELQRQPTLYHYTITVPAIMAIIASLAIFLLPVRSGLRFVLNSVSFIVLSSILVNLGAQFGVSTLGVPVAVHFISVSTLFVGLLQLWLTIAYSTSFFPIRFIKVMFQTYRKTTTTEHEEQHLTKSTKPEMEDILKESDQTKSQIFVLIIDKFVFVVYVFALLYNLVV
ncbi:acetylcholine receptor subunit alpha-type acr-16-like [Oppia nitens]|uniref:acetylcholine receptor subunit alpha-type acr-16-like n=1 Tax=Oppia nitens TaxID=1686743 RepID=UPI0023DBCB05|nr:acetylcholine receptor subunit alpha-type acr-16-like [Oppia nitens]